MSFIAMFGAQAVAKTSDTSKRSKKEPLLMLKEDRTIIFGASAIGAITFALAVFIGDDIYRVDGLRVWYSPFNGQQTDYLVNYCWAHLWHVDFTTNEVVSLYHYAYFPYIMFLFSAIFYMVLISWRFSSFDQFAHVLDHILDGMEEQIRDILQLLIIDIKETEKTINSDIMPTNDYSR